MKISLDSPNIRVDLAEDKISDTEDGTIKAIQIEEQKDMRRENGQLSLGQC